MAIKVFAARVLRPPSRISAGPATIISASRSRGAHGPAWRCGAPTCSSATTKARPGSRPCSSGRNWNSPRTPWSRSPAPSCRPRSTASARADLDRLQGEGRADAVLRFPEGGRARLYRRLPAASTCRWCSASRSTYALGALGGFEGRALAGRRRTAARRRAARRQGGPYGRRTRCAACPGMPAELRVLPGLYWHRITEAAGKALLRGYLEGRARSRPHRLSLPGRPAARLRRRASSRSAPAPIPSNIVDACYPYGSIQVPGGTEPIVLHRDAVSGGGYFMVGTVISADMDLIGQLQPNTPVRFVKVDMDQALAARKVRAELLAKVRSSLKASP